MSSRNSPNSSKNVENGNQAPASSVKMIVKCQASPEKGFGHLSRCMSIHQKCPDHVECLFLVNDDQTVHKILKERNIVYLRETEVKDWNELKPQLLLCDQPDYDGGSRRQIREVTDCEKVALDYDGPFPEMFDHVVNLMPSKYEDKSGSTAFHVGLSFAIIADRFFPLRDECRQASTSVRNVLVLFGGADPANLTCRALSFLNTLDESLNVDVVLGPLNPWKSKAEDLAQRSPHRVTLSERPDNLPELMRKADVALAGCGTTFFELSFVGTPALLLAQHQKEEIFKSYLIRQKLTLDFGGSILDGWKTIRDPEVRNALTTRQMDVFDGRGVSRILSVCSLDPQSGGS